jgi:circadian clock protein KaiC
MAASVNRVETGIDGLDSVLHGGLRPGRAYMVRGTSGTGKTILAYHFLQAGLDAGESALFVAFEEREADLRENAATLGFDLDDAAVLDLSPSAEDFSEDATYSVLNPSEVDGRAVAAAISDAVEERSPDRVVVDPLSQLRHLAADDYQFNHVAASLMSFLKDHGATVVFTSQPTTERSDDDLQYLCDGAITLDRTPDNRTLTVDKFRGSGFQSGVHSLRIDADGARVFPVLDPGTHTGSVDFETVSSGVDSLDSLLGGGIERGSTTLVSGPSGVGKTTTGTTFARAAAERGERAVVYLFEESEASFRHRTEAIGLPLADLVDRGDLVLREIEPLSVSANEFAADVRSEVETRNAGFVMVDGISGYRVGMRDDADVRAQLHSLARYLRNNGVTAVFTDEIGSVTGEFSVSDARVSHIADNILFIRYIEVDGEIRKAVGVLKKRFGAFESTLRSFRIGTDGLSVGDKLAGLRGVLTGTPTTGPPGE